MCSSSCACVTLSRQDIAAALRLEPRLEFAHLTFQLLHAQVRAREQRGLLVEFLTRLLFEFGFCVLLDGALFPRVVLLLFAHAGWQGPAESHNKQIEYM